MLTPQRLPAITLRTWVAAAGVIVLLVGISVGLVIWAGWREVTDAVSRVKGSAIAAVLATSLACYGIRFLRWQAYLAAIGHRVAWPRSLEIFIAGLGFTWTPGKSGELIRGFFLAHYGVPFARSVMLFYWDRLSDLAGMLVLAGLGTLVVASGHGVLLAATLLIAIALWFLRPGGDAFTRMIAFAHRWLRGRGWRWLDDVVHLRDADSKMTVPLVAMGSVAGAAAYAMQAVGFVILARALDVNVGFAQAVLVTSVSTLAGAAILLPAGAGLVETTSVGLLVSQGIAAPDAVALGLVHRAATFWFATALGASAFSALFVRHPHA